MKFQLNSKDLVKQLEKEAMTLVKKELPRTIAEELKDKGTGETPKVTLLNEIKTLKASSSNTVRIEGSSQLLNKIENHILKRK